VRPKVSTRDSKGFTLIELLIALGIIGIIASFAIPMLTNFMKKAKMVEGELALLEIKRLEAHYQADNLSFSGNLSTIGFDPSGLRFYTITIQLNGDGPPPFYYQVTATANLDRDPDLDAWVLTLYADEKSDLKHGCIPGGIGAVQFGCTD